jgi:hypothetical protein
MIHWYLELQLCMSLGLLNSWPPFIAILHQYSMKVPPFATKLWVFSLLFYTALHVSAYKQAIFRCFLTNHKSNPAYLIQLTISSLD